MSEYKEKWASTQCDLLDAKEELKDKEIEREKTFKLLQITLQKLNEKTEFCDQYEEMMKNKQSFNKEDAERVKFKLTNKFLPNFLYLSQHFSKIKQFLQK